MNISINNRILSDALVFPIDGLSANAQEIIREVSDVYQCSRDIVLAAMFSAVGVAVGKKIRIFDNKYFNYPCLWVCAVAPSGSNKSTPVRFILQPLKDRDASEYKVYREELKVFKDSKDEHKERPIFKQLLLSDSTPEARNQVLSTSHNGILLYRDEIKGFLDDIGRYNKSGEVSQLLSVFDSDNIVINRKSDDTLLVEEPFMGVLGTIQPDVLAGTFGNDLLMNNGFNQRWLFVYPDENPSAMYSEKPISKEVREAWHNYINALLDADFKAGGCDTVYIIDEAKQLYIKYYNELQVKKQSTDDSYMSAVYSKLQIIVERWALLTHLLGNNPGMSRILPEEMEYSIRCMDYFERCAEKVYMKLSENRKQPEIKPMGNEEAIARVYYANSPKSQQAFADAIGVSRPFISKCLKKYERLRGYGLRPMLNIDNEDDSRKIAVTT